MKNQRKFMDWASKKLKIKEMNDWYAISYRVINFQLEKPVTLIKDFIKHGGGSMLMKYAGSPIKLLATVFPEYEWVPGKFKNVPRNYWNDIENQRKFMEHIAKELKIKEMSDWYNVTQEVTIFFQ